MFVPFLSEPSVERRKLWRRKGGGGGGRGGGGGGGGRGSSSSGGGSSGAGRGTPISTPGGSRGVSTFSQGGGRPSTITSGNFAGRSQGGGTRGDVYGSRTYGSGYPGSVGQRGTAGLGFPFIFWPLSFGALGAAGGYHYLSHNEYGNPDDENRPGGPQTVASISPSGGGGGGGGGEANNGTFYLLSDRDSVEAMKPILAERCGTLIENKDNIATQRYNGTMATPPRPEQVVQYYRASTAALALEGYNNTAILSEDGGAPDVPLPTNINTELLDCLNRTLGEAIPLEENAAFSHSPAPFAIFTIVGVLLAFM